MKLIRASKDTFTFKLGKREKQSLVSILKLYPRIPAAHQRLSRTCQMPDEEANQHLLDEALAEQRAENPCPTLSIIRLHENRGSDGCRHALSRAELGFDQYSKLLHIKILGGAKRP